MWRRRTAESWWSAGRVEDGDKRKDDIWKGAASGYSVRGLRGPLDGMCSLIGALQTIGYKVARWDKGPAALLE